MTVSFQGTVFIRLSFKMYAVNFSCLFPYIHSRQCAATCIPYGGAILRLTLNFSSLFMSHAVFLLTGLNSPLGVFEFSHFSEIFLSPLISLYMSAQVLETWTQVPISAQEMLFPMKPSSLPKYLCSLAPSILFILSVMTAGLIDCLAEAPRELTHFFFFVIPYPFETDT